MRELINKDRRRLLQLAAISATVAPFASAAAGVAEPFRALKQIDAGPLTVGYVDVGRADAPVALLLHGWPYDIHSFVEVAPMLVSAGYRVIVPYLRGYSTTRFITADAAPATANSLLSPSIRSPASTRSRSSKPSSAGSIGVHARRASSPRCGRRGVGPWFPSAAI